MKTRGRSVVDVKCYILVFACPVTKAVNLQVIESKGADGIVDGLTRLGCETGFPSFMLVDQESSILKALKEAEVDLRSVDFYLYKEKGVRFKTCPVSGHNFHGLVERKIKSAQEILQKCDFATMRLHTTGLQTLCKSVENEMNNLPLGYSYGRDADNSPMLKLIFPNMLRVGRNNKRALEGLVRLPNGPGILMDKVEKAYAVFFRLWNITMVPKLLKFHKWYDGESRLAVGDVVYFQKNESDLASRWSIGQVVEVVEGTDGVIRRATVKYQNSAETEPRETDRAARKLVKLFNIDDTTWKDDMNEVEKILDVMKKEGETLPKKAATEYEVIPPKNAGLRIRLKARSDRSVERATPVQNNLKAKDAKKKMEKCSVCCCQSHHKFQEHEEVEAFQMFQKCVNDGEPDCFISNLLDRSWDDNMQFQEHLLTSALEGRDIMSWLCALHTDFKLGERLSIEDDLSYDSSEHSLSYL